MKHLLQFLSWIALGATIIPALLYLAGGIGAAELKSWMLAGTLVWFGTVPWWMNRAEAAGHS